MDSVNPVALLKERSANTKLSPVELVPYTGPAKAKYSHRPVPRAPFCCATYTSIEGTCPADCCFKGAGCYASAGFTKHVLRRMDDEVARRQLSPEDVIREEVRLIDRQFSTRRLGRSGVPQDGFRGKGRDLRLHVGGDAGSAEGARLLAGAASRWRWDKRGGTVWTYTHLWRVIPRSAWGHDISVLASVETPDQIAEANRLGYPAAIVVESFPADRKAFYLKSSPPPDAPHATFRGKAEYTHKVIPCPAETGRTTCVECRLCLDRDLLQMGCSIGFKVHGVQTTQAARQLGQLVQLRLPDRPDQLAEGSSSPVEKKSRGTYKCRLCGQLGANSRTCPDHQEVA